MSRPTVLDAANAVYGPKGESLGKVTPRGDWPTLKTGATPVKFTCEANDDLEPRACITVFNHGEGL